jgi:hypothetical protein
MQPVLASLHPVQQRGSARHGEASPTAALLDPELRSPSPEAHDRRLRARLIGWRSEGWRVQSVEMAVGIALVVISALLIWGIIRQVGNNLVR